MTSVFEAMLLGMVLGLVFSASAVTSFTYGDQVVAIAINKIQKVINKIKGGRLNAENNI